MHSYWHISIRNSNRYKMSSKKLIIITGASSGIGEKCAQDFSAKGHPLLLLSRRLDRMEKLSLPNTLCEKVDVRDAESFKKAIEKAEKLYGPADLLINNAGVMYLENFVNQSTETLDTMIDINIKGVLNGIQGVLKGMIERKTGTIINISSIAGHKSFPNHVAYCGTKAAVVMISEALREEVSHSNVRVCVVCPGVVETELLSHNEKDIVKGYEQWKKDSGKMLDSKDISDTIQFVYEMPQHVCIRDIVVGPTAQKQ